MLETRVLGRTGLEVTRLGFGAMELAGFRGALDPADTDRLLNRVLDLGITFVDTSPDYGASEELIGRAIADRRDEYFLASKCGCPVTIPFELENGRPVHDFSEANVRGAVEQSLARMRTDHIDLVQVHMSPSRARLEQDGVIDTLRRLQQEGKLRFIGMSGTLPHITDHIAMGVFDAFQIPYSGLEREHEQVIGDAARAGAGTIIRGGVARGAPAPDQDPEDAPDFWRQAMLSKRALWERGGLDDLLDGMSRMEFMLRLTLGHPDVHTIIVGTSNAAHLASNVAAAEQGPLPADVHAEALRRLGGA
jgi:aryl-alcohol dehydrogenase-like predicted oxidoreductase